MKYKILKILFFIALPLIFSGCSQNNLNDNYYNDNKLIAEKNNHGIMSSSTSPLENGKTHSEIPKLDGFIEILEANVNKDTETTLHIKLTVNSGKAKLVLVKPNSEIETLAEAISEKDSKQVESDVSVRCISGANKIKMVGKNYSGNIEIYQPNEVIFKNITDSMSGKNFPFEIQGN